MHQGGSLDTKVFVGLVAPRLHEKRSVPHYIRPAAKVVLNELYRRLDISVEY